MSDWISLTYMVDPTRAQLFARLLAAEGVSVEPQSPRRTDEHCSPVLAVRVTGPLSTIMAAVERLEGMTQWQESAPQPAPSSDVLATSLPRQRSGE
jgi:hypothetical protein